MDNQNSPGIPSKIDALDAVLFAAKAVLTLALVLGAMYALNAAMTGFIAEEREAERVASQREHELRREMLRLQEDYDMMSAFEGIRDHYDGQFKEIFYKIVNAEYILLGTSHITHGVTPEILEQSGRSFFNFALNGATPAYYLWWYNHVFKPSGYITPRAVIFGVNWFMFDSGWLWRRPEFDFQYLDRANRPPPGREDDDFDFAAYGDFGDAIRFTGAWHDVDAVVTHITNRFAVFSARERFIDLVLPQPQSQTGDEIDENGGMGEIAAPDSDAPRERRQRERIVTHEGFVLSEFYKGFVPWHTDFNGHYAGTARANFNPDEEAAFRELLAQFEADGIPVIFVMAPEFLPGRTAPQFDEMLEIINGIAREKNIPFLNYNTDRVSAINFTYAYYSDWGHLNERGAHVFSQVLYEDLREFLDSLDFDSE